MYRRNWKSPTRGAVVRAEVQKSGGPSVPSCKIVALQENVIIDRSENYDSFSA